MSAAGHVFDMINRLRDNRQLRQEQHLKYVKAKEAYQKINLHCPEFYDRIKIKPARN